MRAAFACFPHFGNPDLGGSADEPHQTSIAAAHMDSDFSCAGRISVGVTQI